MSQQPPRNYPPQGQPPYPHQGPYGQQPPQQPPWQGQGQGYQRPPQGYYPPQQPQYPPQGHHQPYPPRYGPPPGPYYPQQPPRKKGGVGKRVLIGLGSLVGLFVLLAVIGSIVGKGSSAATVTPAPASTGAAAAIISVPPVVATPSASPTMKAAPVATPPPKVGSTVHMKNWDVTVTKVETVGKTITGDFGTAMCVGQCIVVAVDLKNTGAANFGFHDFDFNVYTPSNAKISTKSDFGLGSSYNKTRGGTDASQIPPGLTATYYAIFDVADLQGLSLDFQGNPQRIALS